MRSHLWIGFLVAVVVIEGNFAREIPSSEVPPICCNYGADFALTTKFPCSNIKNFNFSGIPGNLHHMCKDKTESCCKEIRNELCFKGTVAAEQTKNCYNGNEIFEDCCNACKTGIEVAQSRGECPEESKAHPLAYLERHCCNKELLIEDDGPADYSEDRDYQDDDLPTDNFEPHENFNEFRNPPDLLIPKNFLKFFQNESYHKYRFEFVGNEIRILCPENHNCEHFCEVENGVATCKCREGYVLAQDKQNCCYDYLTENKRPNESTVRPCMSGYIRNEMGFCEDINECEIENNGCCDDSKCENTRGSYQCHPKGVCRKGFRWNEAKKKCEDIDECFEGKLKAKNPCKCTEKCINTEGSFKCELICNPNLYECGGETWYTTTTKINEFTIPPHFPTTTTRNINITFNCEENLNCPTSDECETSKDCPEYEICIPIEYNNKEIRVCQEVECSQGFELINGICEDINECDFSLNPCPPTAFCQNLPGTFQCEPIKCPSGYRLASNGACIDIDECHDHIAKCKNSQCENTEGSYQCNCYEGFEQRDNFTCIDIDECADEHDCSQICTNTHGSFLCSCRFGFKLDWDRRSCEDIDECLLHPCAITEMCRNLIGGYECVRKVCGSGLQLNDDGECEDIDECEIKNTCINGECTNEMGSYSCDCYPGYEPSDEQDNEFETVCKDIDECMEETHDCSQHCYNTPGSYNCSCDAGYQLGSDNSSCENINECKDHPCQSNELCYDTPGSYVCEKLSCPRGLKYDKNSECVDIDECEISPNICLHGSCINTHGSYYCNCDEGLAINEYGECVDINECQEDHKCQQICQNTFGGYRCHCKRGFRISSDGKTCSDIDECALSPYRCDFEKEICRNTIGRFYCEKKCETNIFCPPVDLNVTTTTENPCEFCGKVVDECRRQSDCADHEKCRIHPKGNICRKLICARGYIAINHKCVGGLTNPLPGYIPPTKPTQRPPNPCSTTTTTSTPDNPCSFTTTTTRPVICPLGSRRGKRGICEENCEKGFKVNEDGACEDIDECDENPCFGRCLNSEGSYSCQCPEGFRENGKFCEDINECEENPCQGENSECLNTVGGYECYEKKCGKHYRMDLMGTCRLTEFCDSKSNNCTKKPTFSETFFVTAYSNFSNQQILLHISPENKFEVGIVKFSAKSEDGVEEATQDKFLLFANEREFSVIASEKIDGPQKIKIILLMRNLMHKIEDSYHKQINLVVFVSEYDNNRYPVKVKNVEEEI